MAKALKVGISFKGSNHVFDIVVLEGGKVYSTLRLKVVEWSHIVDFPRRAKGDCKGVSISEAMNNPQALIGMFVRDNVMGEIAYRRAGRDLYRVVRAEVIEIEEGGAGQC